MSRPFLWAVLGILVLGAGAILVVYVQSSAPSPATAVAEPAVPPAEPVQQPVAPPPAAPSAAPLAGSPPVAPMTAPARAAPVPIPEYQGRLESPDAEERKDVMLEMREQRRAKQLEWQNRNRKR